MNFAETPNLENSSETAPAPESAPELLAKDFISFVETNLPEAQSNGPVTTIEVYGDMPACQLCEQLSADRDASDLVAEYFQSQGQKFQLKYVEHYVSVAYHFDDSLKYKIILQSS